MVLETARLILRPFDIEDVDALEAVHGDAQVMRFSVGGTKTREQIARFIQNARDLHVRDGFSQWAVVWNATGRCIGECGILIQHVDGIREHEISYRLNPKFWGRGIATEAATACRDYGFATFGLKRLVSIIDPQNAASIRVAEKVGMIREKGSIFNGSPVSIFGLDRGAAPPPS